MLLPHSFLHVLLAVLLDRSPVLALNFLSRSSIPPSLLPEAVPSSALGATERLPMFDERNLDAPAARALARHRDVGSTIALSIQLLPAYPCLVILPAVPRLPLVAFRPHLLLHMETTVAVLGM